MKTTDNGDQVKISPDFEAKSVLANMNFTANFHLWNYGGEWRMKIVVITNDVNYSRAIYVTDKTWGFEEFCVAEAEYIVERSKFLANGYRMR